MPQILQKNLSRPEELTGTDDAKTRDIIQRLNAHHLEQYPGDADLAGRIASYELAGRMQMSIPDVMNLAGESAATLAAYGVEGGSELRGSYARNCILARRLLERGVRVVQLFNGSDPSGGNGITNWDSHQNILKNSRHAGRDHGPAHRRASGRYARTGHA